MKILFISLFLPMEKSYHAGGRYVFELLRELSGRHEIHLATRIQEDEFPHLEALRPYCREIHTYTYPAVPRRGGADKVRLAFNYAGFSRFADRLIRAGNYDLVQVEWVETALMLKRRGIPMILDAHDVLTKPAERGMLQGSGKGKLLARLKYRLVKAAELRLVKKFDVIFTLSEYDRRYLLGMEPDLHVRTVPIPAGLDITDRAFEQQRNTILFLSSYRYRRVNVDAALWFCREVFPLVRKSVPDARFVIAGYGPPEELTALADRDPQVEVPGFVEDLDRCYKEAAIFVAPILTGGGIIVKVLDALAAGTPVVTTSYGNEGIGAEPGRDLLVANDPKAFAAAVIRLLNDREYARAIADSGREFVRRNYGLEAVIERIEACYREIAPEVRSEK